MRLTRPNLSTYLLELRPTLSKQTVISYVSLLSNLYFEATGDGDKKEIETDWFAENQEEIIRLLEKRPATSRASILACISVIINDGAKNALIRQALKKNADEYSVSASSGEKTPKQDENWIPYEDVVGTWREYKTMIDGIIAMPDRLKRHHFHKTQFQKFILLSLTCGVYFPPRRSEWCNLKWTGYDEEKDNYIDLIKNQIVLNDYKTAKYYGKTTIPVPEELMYYVERFIAIGGLAPYVFATADATQWQNSRITSYLNEIFEKKVSTTMLRHIYKSHNNPGVESLQKLKEEAKQMGHGLTVSLQYIKH